MSRLGLAVPIEGIELPESLDLAVAAEELGYDDVWSYEVDATDGFTPLAFLAARTRRVRLGISLVPAYSRPPALLAMTVASLQALSAGRFVLGLGSSSPTIVEGWMGLEHRRPVTRVRETIEALRLALDGGKADYSGDTVTMSGFRLGLPPAPTPIAVGALGPRMQRMAGAHADGIILVFNVPARTPELLAPFRAGARAAGRDVGTLEVFTKVFVAVDEELKALRPQLRRFVTGYGTVPAYNRLFARQGFQREAAVMAEAWAEGRRADALAAASDELLEALIVWGSPQECAARIEAHLANGVDTVIVAPISAEPDAGARTERLVHTVRSVAEHVDRSPSRTYIETS